MIQKTLGGERLGAGNKMKVAMHNYERSTHDLGYIWRSTMAAGTLVPFIKEIALPGDTFDINLNADVKTLPTVGPLFGSFKLQLDVFMCPIRLYNAQLHMNKLGVGMDMSKVKFPQLQLRTNQLNITSSTPIEMQQINQSSLLAYLGIRSNGRFTTGNFSSVNYNAMPYLMYWDIYKNYYANKQEEIGAYLIKSVDLSITNIYVNAVDVTATKPDHIFAAQSVIKLKYTGNLSPDNVEFEVVGYGTNYKPTWTFDVVQNNPSLGEMTFADPKYIGATLKTSTIKIKAIEASKNISVKTFSLSNIDTMRENILKQAGTSEFMINKSSIEPYGNIIDYNGSTSENVSSNSQAGLGLKTYQSDKFNNWLKTEWLDGATGINEITSVDVSSGKLNLDSLGLAKKVYDMLNRIAVSGGSYEDWLQAVYTHEPYRRAESPIYLGGLSKEVIFQEVISNAGYQTGSEDQALGTLAGRGTLSQKHKGGYIVAKVDEPSYIIGIVSLTPRIDYSQGFDWDVRLKTMNDLHKPALDQIGFQDLVTWKMHGAELVYDTVQTKTLQYSAGKQPAWLDYMTNVNRCYGNFANPQDQMFMTLNRRYELDTNYRIKDLTTYIDPQKFNYIFADTERDAQNFWVQLGVGITARRKMSAKVMPNL